jgi:hypothetical protein
MNLIIVNIGQSYIIEDKIMEIIKCPHWHKGGVLNKRSCFYKHPFHERTACKISGQYGEPPCNKGFIDKRKYEKLGDRIMKCEKCGNFVKYIRSKSLYNKGKNLSYGTEQLYKCEICNHNQKVFLGHASERYDFASFSQPDG